jgi:hypothetical protein
VEVPRREPTDPGLQGEARETIDATGEQWLIELMEGVEDIPGEPEILADDLSRSAKAQLSTTPRR